MLEEFEVSSRREKGYATIYNLQICILLHDLKTIAICLILHRRTCFKIF